MVRETLRSNQGAQAQEALSTTDPLVAYKHFLHLARALPADSVRVCSVDVEVVYSNVERALVAMEPHFVTAQKQLPGLSIASLLELRSLALALVFAAERIIVATIDGALQHRLLRLRYLRDLTLRQLEIFTHLGLIPGEYMRSVEMGIGPLANAHSALAILGVFEHYDGKVSGKHPFTTEQLVELQGHAQWLIESVRPRIEVGVSPERDAAVLIRDRFWTLLGNRYEDLRKAGAVVFLSTYLDWNVPPLGSKPAPERVRSGTVTRTDGG
jgi:hypothetical protein